MKCRHMQCHQCEDLEVVTLWLEVERLTKERDSMRAVVERLKARSDGPSSVVHRDFHDAIVARERSNAYRRGAEAMRMSVMRYLVRQQNEATVMVVDTAIKGVHKLPIPEEP